MNQSQSLDQEKGVFQHLTVIAADGLILQTSQQALHLCRAAKGADRHDHPPFGRHRRAGLPRGDRLRFQRDARGEANGLIVIQQEAAGPVDEQGIW